MRPFTFLSTVLAASAALLACSSSSSDSGGSQGPSPAATGTTPGGSSQPSGPSGPGAPAAVASGAIDPSCGDSGYVALPGEPSRILPDPAGAIVATSGGLRLVDANGKLDPAAKPGGGGDLVRASDGSLYAVSGTAVHRYTKTFTEDASFAFEQDQWPAESIAGIAVAADGSVYVAGNVAQNTSQEHVVVRHFTASGKYDAAFAPQDDQMPKEVHASEIALAGDGGVLVRADQGFTPAVLRLTKSGALDTTFGDGGLLVLDALGPRYSRAMIVDAQSRILVLGMENDDVQIARLLPSGAPDPAFGKGGIATVSLDTLPLSSDYQEEAEARAMTLDAQGRILVSADYEYTEGTGDQQPKEQTLRLVRFDASGKLDAAFGDKGVAKIDFGPGATASRNVYGGSAFAPLGAVRLLVGGEKTAGTTTSYVLACVKM